MSNIAQILLKNIELLEAKQPLVVNLDISELVQPWLEYHSDTEQVTCFNNNLINHNALTRFSQLDCKFASHYVADNEQVHDLVLIAFPKSKAELAYTLAMIAPVIDQNTFILVVGENKSGIKTINKLATDYIELTVKQDAARHCILYSIRHSQIGATFNLEDWFSYYPLQLNGVEKQIAALPGVFSQQGLDKGTKVLLENLPDASNTSIQGKVLDFGCGAGVISLALACHYDNLVLTLLDVSALAVTSSKKTMDINGIAATVIASDGLTEVNEKFDTIVSNPPFHQGLKTHYAATETFLAAAKQYLKAKGNLLVVANSFLKYQPIIDDNFATNGQLAKDNGFTVYLAQKN